MSRWLDRLSGETFEALPEALRLPGRFVDLETQVSDEPNLQDQTADTYLGAPLDLEQARELESTVATHTNSSFEALAAAKPIALTQDIDLLWNERDAELERSVTLIERICRDPHTLLTTTTELEPVHRARRTRPTALSYLAAHTEDWLHRGVVRVRPRRVLAERRDTVLDVYENRLVARLIDRVLGLIQARLGKLERRETLYKEVAENLESAFASPDRASPNWEWRAQRLCELWGKETMDQTRDQVARETQLKLEDVATRASACRSSELYLAISRHARMDREPHMTNVLRSERRYRQARAHWVTLGPNEAKPIPPQTTTDFMTFAAMLVARALSQLNYRVTSAPAPERVLVDDGLGSVLFERDKRGVLLSRDGNPLLRVLSLPVALDSLSHTHLKAVANTVEPAAEDTILLCWNPISKANATTKLSPQAHNTPPYAGLAHDPRPLDLEIGILPVSPWDLGSVERVARAL
ncbi:MAG TPA: DUF2357 domain-containing protein, partial [Myxococcota bacterium]|nr:DUF2357 domain-containing protein [Myxococcota bacterium]